MKKPPRNGPSLRWMPERPRQPIANGRGYRLLARHYAVRQRLLPKIWKGPLVAALVDARNEGMTLRAAVARMVKELRRAGRQR